jgi:hypothetical protein
VNPPVFNAPDPFIRTSDAGKTTLVAALCRILYFNAIK